MAINPQTDEADLPGDSRPEPFSEYFGMIDQIISGSASDMSNIVEGFNADSQLEFVRFTGYLQRSCSEIQSQLDVARDQQYMSATQLKELYELTAKTGSQIGSFIKYLKQPKTKNQEREQ